MVTLDYKKIHLEEFIDALYLKININRPEELDINLISARMDIEGDYISGPSKCMEVGSHTLILLNDSPSCALQ